MNSNSNFLQPTIFIKVKQTCQCGSGHYELFGYYELFHKTSIKLPMTTLVFSEMTCNSVVSSKPHPHVCTTCIHKHGLGTVFQKYLGNIKSILAD